MLPERRGVAAIASFRWGTFGDFATAAFFASAASGAIVAVPFDSRDAYGSIAAMLLANPAAAFFRNLHFWTAQICLVATLLHAWDHLRARTEHRVHRGVWLRLVLTLPLGAFIMLSGFLLRGDADAGQALRILSEATARIPLLGPPLGTLLFGAGGRLDIVYVQHAATATLVVWLFVVEHARRLWPRPPALLAVTLVAGGLSLVLSPGLHDGFDPVIKGPWYFLGLQEILHWTSRPEMVVLGGACLLAALYAVRDLSGRAAGWTRRALAALAVAYLALCAVGGFLRGESWALDPHWPSGSSDLHAGWIFRSNPGAPAPPPSPLPVVMGRPEGCLICHRDLTGLGPSHRPDAVGCASCHGGDPFTLHKGSAHAGMDLFPGNLAGAGRACGQAACHAAIVPRVERSLMATMSGIVAVDRAVFGEASRGPDQALPHVDRLGGSAADTHLRQLCASCHLGARKKAFGPNGEDARGGGCSSCHLSYSPEALAALSAYEERKVQGFPEAPRAHPAVSLDIDTQQCFGCHSRSGRISTSYQGWHEVHQPPAEAADPLRPEPSRFRTLADERVFERVTPDVHQQAGLDCIDCHTSVEVMGDGEAHSRKGDRIRVACVDCHAPSGTSLPTLAASELDPESRRVLSVRGWSSPTGRRFARTAAGGALLNLVVDPAGPPYLLRKRTGERRELKPTAPVCVEGRGHARLTCGSCHTAWAPRCPTCHTSFDRVAEAYDWVDDAYVTGAWREEAGAFVADPPTLGVRRLGAGGAGQEVIGTFAPGMILTVDRNRAAGRRADPVFRRLFAPVEPHTTRREARGCESCHNDPVAIGYGRGDLRYERGDGAGRWRFAPAAEPLAADRLPADAWMAFLGTRSGMVSTRGDARPLSPEEQRRVLRVGACLTCHPGDSAVMRRSVGDFDAVLARRSPRCLLPRWD